jgi:hypothetical protein
MKKRIYIAAAALCIAVITVCISHCNTKHQSSPVTAGKTETTALIKGHADTTTRLKQVKGTMRLRKIQRAASDSVNTYTGSINDSLANVSVTAHVSQDSTFIDLDYAGAIAEKIISQTDTLLHNTIEVQELKSPWYDSFAVGIITAGVVLVIYLVFQTAL